MPDNKEKTIRDLNPLDIKISTLARLFGGIWTIVVLIGLIVGVGVILVSLGDGHTSVGNNPLSVGLVLTIFSIAELKYKFVKKCLIKVFS